MPRIIYERCGEKVIRLTSCQDCETTVLFQPSVHGRYGPRCKACMKKRKQERNRGYYLASKIKKVHP